MKRTFTRRELYDLVWSSPILKLAEQFEISDRGLAKTCERHQIPVPGRGYWARLEAGQSVTKTPLWKIDNPALETVHIGGTKPAINPYVELAIQTAAAVVRKSKSARHDVPASSQAEARSSPRQPVTFDPVKRPHISVSGIAVELRNTTPDEIGEISVAGIRIQHSTRTRLIAFLHHFALGLEQRGVHLKQGDRGIIASIEPDDIRIEITEDRRRAKHVPTPTELRKKQEFDTRWELARKRGQWLDNERFWPEYDYIHSGKLTFEIANWADGARKRWADGKTQSVESMLDGICDGVLFHLAYDKARREEREEQERRRRHLAHRRELHQKRQQREGKRLSFLRALAKHQREAKDLKVTIEAASAALETSNPVLSRMMEWAKVRLRYLEAQNDPEMLTTNLVQQNLFPETDELHDPEGDPPEKRNYWDD
ncbi:hypothetical protein JJB09_11300 [Rhizobium sp. KVB221]|uniref:Uncharacterized protein n=1 Tax=Rhizobium setariae TaxID=2801340 RepID=A0A936YLF3_9HYPH|nr:hypothetical protein [Rhizobium setariae]MBL0372614.1 hypothetical protein [Rhizobium setariae]